MLQSCCNTATLSCSVLFPTPFFAAWQNAVVPECFCWFPECTISSFSEYILCANTRFHLRQPQWPSGKLLGTYVNRDCEVQGANPDNFACRSGIFTNPSGMSERSFCIFRRIHVRLPLASQIAYECFPFTAVPQTDLKHFQVNLESSLGYAWLTGKSTPT